jgi:hypothetical protein
MKLFISLSLVCFAFFANAESSSVTEFKSSNIEAVAGPGGPGKQSRKHKRINKRRKKKCKQWGKRSYAG